jgi:hypothetical protein
MNIQVPLKSGPDGVGAGKMYPWKKLISGSWAVVKQLLEYLCPLRPAILLKDTGTAEHG